MAASPENDRLFQDLSAKLDSAADPETLAVVMGAMLRSLLRRSGDTEFLKAVQDAFIAGMGDRDWNGQRQLAREVLRVVIDIRPEIAVAWQALHANAPQGPARRATDQMAAQPQTEAAPAPAPEAAEEASKAATAQRQTERLVAAYVAGVLERRLALFQLPVANLPSAAYCHEQPFFMFSPVFAKVVCRFVTDELLALVKDNLQRHAYDPIAAKLPAAAEEVEQMLSAKRPMIWKILDERLGKLAGHHRSAEAKLAAQDSEDGGANEYRMVEVPETRPRTFKVLGVSFALGQTTAMRKVKVKTSGGGEIDADEMQALTLITSLRNLAAGEGLELPEACDFQFLRALLTFDARKFSQSVKEYTALAGHDQTSRTFLFDRLRALDELYPNTLCDALVLMLFQQLSDRGFGLRELYDICVGTAREASAQARKRPFVHPEVARRPRELAFQFREALRRRCPPQTVGAVAEMLLDCWRVMNRARFAHELDAALTVLAAFPIAFAGDPDEGLFVGIGQTFCRALTAATPDYAACIQSLSISYRTILAHQQAANSKQL